MSGYLYHYTDAAGCKAIISSGYIKSSSGPGDAAFGPGVYLTAIPPQASTMEILLNNWDSSVARLRTNIHAISKTEYCFGFPLSRIPNATPVGSKRDVWLHRGDLFLQGTGVIVYER